MDAPQRHNGIMSFVDIRAWLVKFAFQLEEEKCEPAFNYVATAISLLDEAQKLGIEARADALR